MPVGPLGTKPVNASWPNYMAVPTGSPHPDEGFLFCEGYSTYSVAEWFKEVFDLPSWKDFPYDVLSKGVVDNFGMERAQEINDFWFGIREEAYPQWCSPVSTFCNDTLNAAFDQIMHKTATPEEGLAQAQASIQAQLEQTLAGV